MVDLDRSWTWFGCHFRSYYIFLDQIVLENWKLILWIILAYHFNSSLEILVLNAFIILTISTCSVFLRLVLLYTRKVEFWFGTVWRFERFDKIRENVDLVHSIPSSNSRWKFSLKKAYKTGFETVDDNPNSWTNMK